MLNIQLIQRLFVFGIFPQSDRQIVHKKRRIFFYSLIIGLGIETIIRVSRDPTYATGYELNLKCCILSLKVELYLVRQQLSLISRSYEICTRTAKDSLRAPSQKVQFLTPCVKEGMGQECVRTTFPSSNSKDNRNS